MRSLRMSMIMLSLLICCAGLAILRAEPKAAALGKNVSLVVDGEHREVHVEARVCIRQGMLEQLLCRKNTKEHEAILTADVDGRDIHKALLIARAKPGTPFREVTQKDPKPRLATGTRIRVILEYLDDKKQTVRVAAGEWVRDSKTKKTLTQDWVFAGSQFVEDPMAKEKPPYYLANDGDLITVCNFEDAMLDLPLYSSKNNDLLSFEPNTEKIPPLETPVTVILEPVFDKAP